MISVDRELRKAEGVALFLLPRSPDTGYRKGFAIGHSDPPALGLAALIAGLEESKHRHQTELSMLPGAAVGRLLAGRNIPFRHQSMAIRTSRLPSCWNRIGSSGAALFAHDQHRIIARMSLLPEAHILARGDAGRGPFAPNQFMAGLGVIGTIGIHRIFDDCIEQGLIRLCYGGSHDYRNCKNKNWVAEVFLGIQNACLFVGKNVQCVQTSLTYSMP